MKTKIVNFVALVGFVLLGLSAMLGVLIGVLFIFPNVSIFGSRAVNERDTQIVYHGDELEAAFTNGKFIIESTGAQIEVKMSNAGYDGQETIVVNESATGIAFNSLNRTLIEWTQTLYGESNDVYYRIKVLEPSGFVFNQKPTTVYINLPYRNDPTFRYDFVLENQYSPVNFSFVDNTANNVNALQIDNLIVESAASVNFPENQNINHLTMKGQNTKLNCKSIVNHNVLVTGKNNNLDFDVAITEDVTIRGELNQFNGVSARKLIVNGKNNRVNFSNNLASDVNIQGNANYIAGISAGAVTFTAKNGSLNFTNTVTSLEVGTVNANVAIGTVTGDAFMETVNGDLQVRNVGNGLTFNAGKVDDPNALASVTAGQVTGNVSVNNFGTGSINLSNVDGNVIVRSYQVGGGAINVGLTGSNAHDVDIIGYDGNINVRGLNGGVVELVVNGEQKRAGAANVYAEFNAVGANTEIRPGGYISGHDDWGNVEVKFANTCNDLDLYIQGTRSVHAATKYGAITVYKENEPEVANTITLAGGEKGTLKIYAHNRVYLS